MYEWLSQIIPQGSTIFDIGAYHGELSAQFIEHGAARVIAVEPVQEHCSEILSRHEPRIIVVHKACGAQPGLEDISVAGTVSSFIPETWWTGRFSFIGKGANRKESVEIVTLDNLISEYGLPQYIKIDAEGYELNIVKGLTQRVSVLSFEFLAENFGQSALICDHLRALGFSKFLPVYGTLFPQEWLEFDELIAKLKEIRNTDLWGDIVAR